MIANRIPPISVGLPVYNGERYLEETLKSILSQTYEDFTLLICDNASTDRTQEICQTYASQDSRIQYFCNEENIGVARNFNRVFNLSKSKYFKWIACDDIIASEFLRVCEAMLDNEPEVILAYPKTKLIDETGEVIGSYEDGLNLVSHTPHGRFLQVFHNIWLVNPVFGLIRSEVLKKTHLFGNYPHSDLVFLAELSLFGQFREAPQYLFFFRLHTSSSSGGMLSGNKVICIKTDEEKLSDFNPGDKQQVPLKKKRRLIKKYLMMIKQAPMPINSKILLSTYLITYTGLNVLKRYSRRF
jgi:glycosyltransferase involved in cell wall biosynthesis